MHNTRESGRTLLETLAVIGIMGILTVGSIGIYTKARNKLLRMQSIDEISELVDNIRTLFAGKTSYEGLTIGYLERMGGIKNKTNPFGQEIVVRPANSNEEFAITYPNMSRPDCIYFGTVTWEDAESIFINGSAPNTLTAQCAEGQVNNVTIYYK